MLYYINVSNLLLMHHRKSSAKFNLWCDFHSDRQWHFFSSNLPMGCPIRFVDFDNACKHIDFQIKFNLFLK